MRTTKRTTVIERNQPWYGKYTTKVSFRMPYAAALRLSNHKQIDKQMKIRREWANEMMKPGYGSWEWLVSEGTITDEVIAHLHTLFDFLKNQKDYRTIIDQHIVNLYTNSEDTIKELMDFSFVNSVDIVKLIVIGTADSIILKRSKFLYRTYFRYHSCKSDEITSIMNYLSSQEDIQLSPHLQWIQKHGLKTLRNHSFFDHMSPNTAYMLHLINPSIIRKTLTIKSNK